jgi:3-hydroxyisobutyrate dehydrogenase
MASIGFIGLGNMGAPMAANLVKAGHGVTGYDLNPAALRTLMAAGGRGAGSASEAAKGADVVITMLPAGEDVREVWLHRGGLIAAVGTDRPLLIDCSTIDVDSARAVTAVAAAAGLAMLDAPVSGGTAGAQNATLTFMVGGTEDAFARGQRSWRRWERTSSTPAGPAPAKL